MISWMNLLTKDGGAQIEQVKGPPLMDSLAPIFEDRVTTAGELPGDIMHQRHNDLLFKVTNATTSFSAVFSWRYAEEMKTLAGSLRTAVGNRERIPDVLIVGTSANWLVERKHTSIPLFSSSHLKEPFRDYDYGHSSWLHMSDSLGSLCMSIGGSLQSTAQATIGAVNSASTRKY